MFTLSKLTIKKKLTVILMLTSTIAVLFACMIFMIFSLFRHRQDQARNLAGLADVIGQNCQASLKFDIPEDAAQMLAALSARPSVVFACIYDLDGNVFATYLSDPQQKTTPPEPRQTGHIFKGGYLQLFHRIHMGTETIGTVYLQDDMREVYAGLRRDTATLVMVMVVALVTAYIIASRLQALISGPILSLAETAKVVSDKKDYGIRAVKQSEDEVGMLIDSFNEMLTQIQRRDDAVRESEERFRDFFENAPIGFHIFGSDRVITDINEAELTMLGYTSDEMISKKTWADLIIPEQKKLFEKHWKDIITKGEAKDLEYTLVSKDGQHINVILNASSRFDDAGNFINTRGSVLNITQRKRAEQARDMLNVELILKNKELESILHVASHDLRSPLVNIQGFCHELSQSCDHIRSALGNKTKTVQITEQVDTSLNRDIPEALDFILASAGKMDSLLSGLLRLSRLGRAAMQVELLNMNEILADVAGNMEYQIKESNATVQIDPLPPCFGDASQINQVFSNLFDNALKFLDESQPGVIHISGKIEEGQRIYCIEDNGVGIAPDHQEKIFEIFHRLEPDMTTGEGLGLTIVRRIIDRHNGKVWVESQVAKGSKFYVALPGI